MLPALSFRGGAAARGPAAAAVTTVAGKPMASERQPRRPTFVGVGGHIGERICTVSFRRFRQTVAAAAVATSALLGASLLTAGPASAEIIYAGASTADGRNTCEWQITSQDIDHSFYHDLQVQTHGATYSCFVQVVDFANVTHSYYDYPGNGWSYYGFQWAVRRARACQNGNPGACGPWRNGSDGA
jgi:hypothetical protein